MRAEILAEAKEAIASRDFEKVTSLLVPFANTGDAEAQFLLGTLYFEGMDLPASDAHRWLSMAAEQNHPDACHKLACFIGGGEFVKSGEEVRNLLLKAA